MVQRVLSLIDVISRKVLINKGLRGFCFIYQQNGMEAPDKGNQPLWTCLSTDYQNINQAEHPVQVQPEKSRFTRVSSRCCHSCNIIYRISQTRALCSCVDSPIRFRLMAASVGQLILLLSGFFCKATCRTALVFS